MLRPVSLHDFVHEHYPKGLGASFDTIERLIGDREDVRLLWSGVSGRGQGSRTDLLDNIQEVPAAPTGTSKEAGLRKLQKAATEGNEEAAAQFSGSNSAKFVAAKNVYRRNLTTNECHKGAGIRPTADSGNSTINSTLSISKRLASETDLRPAAGRSRVADRASGRQKRISALRETALLASKCNQNGKGAYNRETVAYPWKSYGIAICDVEM